jgi:membrane protease YdiL (CAAX protease family)
MSAFLYAVYPMNLFLVLPYFLLGLALGFLVLRTNSILPAVVAHLAFNALKWSVLLVPGLDSVLPAALAQTEVLGAGGSVASLVALALAVLSAIVAVIILAGVWVLSRADHTSGEFPIVRVARQPSSVPRSI